MVPWAGLQCVIVVFPDHTHLNFKKMLFQCRSYKHWHRINVDEATFQPCMFAWACSREFVPRFCFLGAFQVFVHSYSIVETVFRHVNILFLLSYWFALNQKTLTDKAKHPIL